MKRLQADKTGSSIKLYEGVVSDIRSRIEDGSLMPAERLPSIDALSQQYGVSKITVIRALKELNISGHLESRPRSGVFVRTQAASKPMMSGEKLIALMVTAPENSFFADIIRGAEEECRGAGYRLMVVISNNELAQQNQHLSELASQTAGLIIAPVTGKVDYNAYMPLLDGNVPFVFVDRYVEKLAVPFVSTDNEEGGYLATRHLLELGLRRIFVLSDTTATSTRERIQGYRRALKEFGVPFDAALVRHSRYVNDAAGYDLTRELLQEGTARGMHGDEPFAVFALQDAVARGSYVALKEAGLSIPTDVPVVGFDDVHAVFMDPPLTSVRQDLQAMGVEAVRALLEVIRYGSTQPPRAMRLKPTLVIRNSSDAASTFYLADYIKNAGILSQSGGDEVMALDPALEGNNLEVAVR